MFLLESPQKPNQFRSDISINKKGKWEKKKKKEEKMLNHGFVYFLESSFELNKVWVPRGEKNNKQSRYFYMTVDRHELRITA